MQEFAAPLIKRELTLSLSMPDASLFENYEELIKQVFDSLVPQLFLNEAESSASASASASASTSKDHEKPLIERMKTLALHLWRADGQQGLLRQCAIDFQDVLLDQKNLDVFLSVFIVTVNATRPEIEDIPIDSYEGKARQLNSKQKKVRYLHNVLSLLPESFFTNSENASVQSALFSAFFSDLISNTSNIALELYHGRLKHDQAHWWDLFYENARLSDIYVPKVKQHIAHNTINKDDLNTLWMILVFSSKLFILKAYMCINSGQKEQAKELLRENLNYNKELDYFVMSHLVPKNKIFKALFLKLIRQTIQEDQELAIDILSRPALLSAFDKVMKINSIFEACDVMPPKRELKVCLAELEKKKILSEPALMLTDEVVTILRLNRLNVFNHNLECLRESVAAAQKMIQWWSASDTLVSALLQKKLHTYVSEALPFIKDLQEGVEVQQVVDGIQALNLTPREETTRSSQELDAALLRVRTLEQVIEQLEIKLQKRLEELSTLQKAHSSVREKSTRVREESEQRLAKIADLKEQIKGLRQENSTLNNHVKETKSQGSELSVQLRLVRAEHQSLSQKYNLQTKSSVTAQAHVRSLEDQLSFLKNNTDRLLHENHGLQTKYDESLQTISELKLDITDLTEARHKLGLKFSDALHKIKQLETNLRDRTQALLQMESELVYWKARSAPPVLKGSEPQNREFNQVPFNLSHIIDLDRQHQEYRCTRKSVLLPDWVESLFTCLSNPQVRAYLYGPAVFKLMCNLRLDGFQMVLCGDLEQVLKQLPEGFSSTAVPGLYFDAFRNVSLKVVSKLDLKALMLENDCSDYTFLCDASGAVLDPLRMPITKNLLPLGNLDEKLKQDPLLGMRLITTSQECMKSLTPQDYHCIVRHLPLLFKGHPANYFAAMRSLVSCSTPSFNFNVLLESGFLHKLVPTLDSELDMNTYQNWCDFVRIHLDQMKYYALDPYAILSLLLVAPALNLSVLYPDKKRTDIVRETCSNFSLNFSFPNEEMPLFIKRMEIALTIQYDCFDQFQPLPSVPEVSPVIFSRAQVASPVREQKDPLPKRNESNKY